MSTRTLTITDQLYAYLTTEVSREPAILADLRRETAEHPRAGMQISPEQGQFMQMLVKLLGAKKGIEIGVFTGYSSLATILAMPADGTIVACDVSEEFTAVARRYWERADVDERISLKLAPANETLDALLADGQAGTFDFAFIDADKSSYDGYYERCLELLRAGGLIAVDNALWSGAVADPGVTDPDTSALRALNAKMKADERVDFSMVPIGDGLALARKR
jgi:caffeoyl-CoA O-methyltransferase